MPSGMIKCLGDKRVFHFVLEKILENKKNCDIIDAASKFSETFDEYFREGVETADMDERFYLKYAAAAIRGNLRRTGREELLPSALMTKSLDALTPEDYEAVFSVAQANGIKFFDFKKNHRYLPRVNRAIGFLKGLSFSSLLDVGSGRGVFLIPFMDEFPWVSVTALDLNSDRIRMLSDIRDGGIDTLSVRQCDVCDAPFSDGAFDVVTLLEVLEHIPDYRAAIRAAVAMARQYVVITVPSHEDINPEHIHFLTKERLSEAFAEVGVTRLSFDGVHGHLFLAAKVGE